VGFGQLSSYGGLFTRPTSTGWRRKGCVTTISTPPRSARRRRRLVDGRNHHEIGLAAITGGGHGLSGSNGTIPKSAATLAEVLKQNGYNTIALGKWHLRPTPPTLPRAPSIIGRSAWGSKNITAFWAAETDQWAPLLVQDNHFIDAPKRPGYHLSEDLVDHAIADIRDHSRPIPAGPLHVSGARRRPCAAACAKAFIDKYKGNSTRAGTRRAKKPSSAKRKWASSR